MKMKLLAYSCSMVLLCLFAQNCAGQGRASFGLPDIINSAGTIIEGVGKEVINRIPTPEDLFHVSRQVLVGLPETAIYQTIGNLCRLYMAAETIEPRITSDIDSMSLRLIKPCKKLSFPLNQAEKILESPEFDANKTVVIFVTGWMSSSESDYVADMANAYNCRGNYNFLALNSSEAIDTLYTWSAYNTEEVGRSLAVGLEKLVETVPVENIHLIGHSLGAHIVGYAGRYFAEQTGSLLTRITGLDPANPCFAEGSKLSGLQRGDAQFIDIIHTNNGALGKSNSVGDVDFYPGGMATIQAGCTKFPCSHGRAYEYYTESVYPGNENNFLGTRCTSLWEVNKGSCTGKQIPMGFAVPHSAKGNYYLSVNGKKPYGKNSNRNGAAAECGKCDQEE